MPWPAHTPIPITHKCAHCLPRQNQSWPFNWPGAQMGQVLLHGHRYRDKSPRPVPLEAHTLWPRYQPCLFELTPACPSTWPASEGCPPMLPSSLVALHFPDLPTPSSLQHPLPPTVHWTFQSPAPFSPCLFGSSWILVPLPHLWPPGAPASLVHFQCYCGAEAAWLASCFNTAGPRLSWGVLADTAPPTRLRTQLLGTHPLSPPHHCPQSIRDARSWVGAEALSKS